MPWWFSGWGWAVSRVFVVGVIVMLVAVFVGGIGLMAWRDHEGTIRCHHIGGQTYDSGSHCVVGGRTVSTR